MSFGPSKTFLETKSGSYESSADEQFAMRMENEGLDNGGFRQFGVEFTEKELLSQGDESILIHGTHIDYFIEPDLHAIFLDGPDHLGRRQSFVDSMVKRILEERGWMVSRFPFDPIPRGKQKNLIPEERLNEMVEEVRRLRG